jgi:hypothetical protein
MESTHDRARIWGGGNRQQGSTVKNFTVVVATFLIAHSAQALEQEVTMVEVEMTPMALDKPLAAGKADARFESYALEGFGCCGLQPAAAPEAAAARRSRLPSAQHAKQVKHRVVLIARPR